MMWLEYDRAFIKAAAVLPKAQQRKLAGLIEQLRKNPFNPLLHSKPLSGSLSGFFSFRITRDWRVIFQFLDADTIRLLDVAHRKDMYR
jgi:addiction module RelE/StbE family toxin